MSRLSPFWFITVSVTLVPASLFMRNQWIHCRPTRLGDLPFTATIRSDPRRPACQAGLASRNFWSLGKYGETHIASFASPSRLRCRAPSFAQNPGGAPTTPSAYEIRQPLFALRQPSVIDNFADGGTFPSRR